MNPTPRSLAAAVEQIETESGSVELDAQAVMFVDGVPCHPTTGEPIEDYEPPGESTVVADFSDTQT